MEVSQNRGTPKSSIVYIIGCSIINQPFWDTPILGNPHINIIHSQISDVRIATKSWEGWIKSTGWPGETTSWNDQGRNRNMNQGKWRRVLRPLTAKLPFWPQGKCWTNEICWVLAQAPGAPSQQTLSRNPSGKRVRSPPGSRQSCHCSSRDRKCPMSSAAWENFKDFNPSKWSTLSILFATSNKDLISKVVWEGFCSIYTFIVASCGLHCPFPQPT